jgi:cell division protein ZapA (FtsZ GTPase activity inhibitor)
MTGCKHIVNHLHTITLFGRSYTFEADTPSDQAEEVMNHLAEELRQIETAASGKPVPKNETALLLSAALNIANAYVELKTSHAALTEELSRRIQGLTERLSKIGHCPQTQ